MSKIIEKLKKKFSNLEAKIELKQHSINGLFEREIIALNANYNEQNLEVRYSRELNLYRDGLLKQKETKMRLEIDQVNMMGKKIKNLEFKRGVVKSAKLCIGKLIKKEFKLSRIFDVSQLIRYKNYLGLDEVIQTVDESNDENVLAEAMFISVINGSLETAKLFVEYGADVNGSDAFTSAPYSTYIVFHILEFGKTVLMLASKYGHLEVVKYLVENGADVNAKRGYDNQTALLLASSRGHFEIVKYLVENGADVNAKIGYQNETALIYASGRGYLEMVKYLTENGADVNAKDDWHRTALMYGDVNARDEYKETALMRASVNGHLEIVKYLVEHGADVNATNADKKTALKLASENFHLKIVKYLFHKKVNFLVAKYLKYNHKPTVK